jgi:UDP-2-acetamido-2,6-beta-L-arabino-hexul-4-ose reductase
MKIRIGITGQQGFVGQYLYNTLGLYPEEFERVTFKKEYFSNTALLNEFAAQCDVIIHLASMNRHNDPQLIYNTNVELTEKLVNALEFTQSNAHVIFSSSTQEERENEYGKSKKISREYLQNWAQKSAGKFTGLIIPNVFGPFGHPFHNSVIATFCHKLAHDQIPTIDIDAELKLIYVGELIEVILLEIRRPKRQAEMIVPFTATAKVSEILNLLNKYKEEYLEKGIIPVIKSAFELNLFNTFRCYIDIANYFPKKFVAHTDNRGAFVEIARLGIPGQTSFSTTLQGITRGNHYHTRKIERFAVIKGKALIQLRRIGTQEVYDFYLDGNEPAYVDMPIWFTHNIKNIGDDLLYTIFWINEPFDANNPDTYFEIV